MRLETFYPLSHVVELLLSVRKEKRWVSGFLVYE